MIKSHDRNRGYSRETFRHFDHLVRTKMECPPPCLTTNYHVKLGGGQRVDYLRTMTIGFANALIKYQEEYIGCDGTCLIGEFGGNLGFFLGGSLLFGIDVMLQQFANALLIIHVVWNKMSIRM